MAVERLFSGVKVRGVTLGPFEASIMTRDSFQMAMMKAGQSLER